MSMKKIKSMVNNFNECFHLKFSFDYIIVCTMYGT